jgi:hypothetical protein
VGDFAQYRMYEIGERAEDGAIRYHDSEIDTEWTYTSREGSQHDTIKQEVAQWASQLFGRPVDVQHNGAGDWELGLPPNSPDDDGADYSERHDAEVAALKQSFEFELCERCNGDLDAHTFAPDPLGHAHMLCNSDPNDNDDELSPDAARCPQLLPPDKPAGTTKPTGESTNLISSIKFCAASASSARHGVGEVETFTASLTTAGVRGEPLRRAAAARELLEQLGVVFDELAGELQRHTVVAEAYQSVGDDAGSKQFNQVT